MLNIILKVLKYYKNENRNILLRPINKLTTETHKNANKHTQTHIHTHTHTLKALTHIFTNTFTHTLTHIYTHSHTLTHRVLLCVNKTKCIMPPRI
jgi:phosphoglycerate-specific signal transduction histidine kinase